MKDLLLAAGAMLILATAPAFSQTSAAGEADANSSASLITDLNTSANVFEDNRVYGDAGDGVADGTIYSDATIENVPDVNAPSMGSGHPCSLGRSAGLAIVGFGASGGAAEVDEACMLIRSNNPRWQRAGMLAYASRDRAVCQALMAVGEVRSCGGTTSGDARIVSNQTPSFQPQGEAVGRDATMSSFTTDIAYSKCSKRIDGKLEVTIKRGADKATAIAQCKALY